jgi:hypothetical protein
MSKAALRVTKRLDYLDRVATETGTALTLNADEHDGRIIAMSLAGSAVTYTLPDATGSGAKFKFVVGIVNTSNYVIQVANASDIMQGSITTVSTTDTPDLAQPWITTGTSDTITLNGTTTGGLTIGDWIEVTDLKDNTWTVTGVTSTSGVEATPFSAAV